MTVRRDGPTARLHLHSGPPENSCRPAVDVLFRSVAAAYGPGVLAVVLTGMGQDGLRGAEQIVEAGGTVLAQDQATSVVWGMPGFVSGAGLADEVLPIGQLGLAITERARRGRGAALRQPPGTTAAVRAPSSVPGAPPGPANGRAASAGGADAGPADRHAPPGGAPAGRGSCTGRNATSGPTAPGAAGGALGLGRGGRP